MNITVTNHKLPPLNAIKAFEASARHGGFKRAAEELSVSPAAISHQVKLLESHLGEALFDRQANGVLLTPMGELVFRQASEALNGLLELPRRIARRNASPRVVLSIEPSLGARWIYRAIGSLHRAMPEIRFEIREEGEPVSFSRDLIDIRIAYAAYIFPGFKVRPIFTDRLTPLCTPDFLQQHSIDPTKPNDLPDDLLIHSFWGQSLTSYPSWSDWFGANGIAREARVETTGHSVMMPASAIELALSGVGIALGQRFLAAPEIAAGQLVAPFGTEITLPYPYAMVTRAPFGRDTLLARIAEWLILNVKEAKST